MAPRQSAAGAERAASELGSSFSTGDSKHRAHWPDRVLFVVAHPDDECMFFGPSILDALFWGSSVLLLSLSSGNVDGLGAIREQELRRSCKNLGMFHENVHCVEDSRLQDGFSVSWDPAVVANAIQARLGSSVELVVTFDCGGITGHPNHRDTCEGARRYARTNGTPMLYLETVPIARRFTLLVDVGKSFFGDEAQLVRRVWCRRPLTCIGAMMQHRSQLAWFRVAFILFSRYTYVNTLKHEPF